MSKQWWKNFGACLLIAGIAILIFWGASYSYNRSWEMYHHMYPNATQDDFMWWWIMHDK